LFATVAISHGWWSLSRCYPHVSAGYWHNGGITASGSYGCDVGCCWLLEAWGCNSLGWPLENACLRIKN
jgi:hypothetical protein